MINYYDEIIKKIWEIMPMEAKEYIFECCIYNDQKGTRGYWLNQNNLIEEYNITNFPHEHFDTILILIVKLKEVENQEWNQCRINLNEKGEFKFSFAYINQDDTWPMLYMKGVSDLTLEEAKEYYIPQEVWEERVRIKNSKS